MALPLSDMSYIIGSSIIQYIGAVSYFIMVEICCANQSESKFLCFCGSGISIGPSLNPHSLSLNKILVTLSL